MFYTGLDNNAILSDFGRLVNRNFTLNVRSTNNKVVFRGFLASDTRRVHLTRAKTTISRWKVPCRHQLLHRDSNHHRDGFVKKTLCGVFGNGFISSITKVTVSLGDAKNQYKNFKYRLLFDRGACASKGIRRLARHFTSGQHVRLISNIFLRYNFCRSSRLTVLGVLQLRATSPRVRNHLTGIQITSSIRRLFPGLL